MVPGFQEFMLPLLKFMGDGQEHSRDDIIEGTLNSFSFSEEDKQERTREGSKLKIHDRVEWSITYLKQAGLLTRTRKSHYVIAQEGINLLGLGLNELTSKYLYQHYQSFRDFQNRKRGESKSEESVLSKNSTNATSNKETNGNRKRADYLEYKTLIENLKKFNSAPSDDQLKRLHELYLEYVGELTSKLDLSCFNALAKNIEEPLAFVVTIDKVSGVICKSVDHAVVSSIEGIELKMNSDDSNYPTKRKRRPNWNFYNIGLIEGDVIEYIPDPSQKATVVSEKGVTYEGEEFQTLEALTKLLFDSDKSLDSTAFWAFDGKRLCDLYNEAFPKE